MLRKRGVVGEGSCGGVRERKEADLGTCVYVWVCVRLVSVRGVRFRGGLECEVRMCVCMRRSSGMRVVREERTYTGDIGRGAVCVGKRVQAPVLLAGEHPDRGSLAWQILPAKLCTVKPPPRSSLTFSPLALGSFFSVFLETAALGMLFCGETHRGGRAGSEGGLGGVTRADSCR